MRSSWRWMTAAVLTMVPTLVLALLPDSSFEGQDGNLVQDGGTDWQSLVGSPRLVVGRDLPSGQTDDSLSGKEDDVVPGIEFGSIPSNKSDLLRFYAYHERKLVGDAERDFLYLAWVRADTLGTANMDFEFNQSSVLTANGSTVERTEGDMLITYGFTGSSNVVALGLSRWTQSGPCESSPSGPCWGPVMPLTGIAEGAVNSTQSVLDPITGGTLLPLTFGEAAIDLTAAGVFDSDSCVSFGRGYVKSRSSNSFSSSMKDFIRPIDVRVTNCGTVTIRKVAVPESAQDFSFAASPEIGGFDLDDDGNEGNALPSQRSITGRFEGTFSVTEQAAAGWDLTDLACSAGGTPVRDADGRLTGEVSLALSAGSTVDCTYTNTARGRLRVLQAVAPSGDPQSFDFAVSGGTSFALVGGGSWDSGSIATGTYAIAQTDPGPAWDLQSAVCDDGSLVGAVQVGPGETVTCVFTNVKRGQLVVDEVTVPSGETQSFAFTAAGESFSLTDGAAPHASALLVSGVYAAAQSPVPAGFDLTSSVCDDGSAPAAVTLSPGEVVTCTFTHTKRATLIVDEVTLPAGDPQAFAFVAAGASFSLTDAAAPHPSAAFVPGSYSVSQTNPAGWDLQSAVCDDGSAPGSVSLSAGETVTCTFTNVKRGHVLVDVVTSPAGDPQAFGFSLSGGPDAISQSFSLTDAAAAHDSGVVRPGTYAATAQATPAGWDLTASSCSDGSAPAAVGLGAGETVTCTFTYVKRGVVRVDVVTEPSGDPQSFAFTAAGESFSLTDFAAPHASAPLVPGSYAVSPSATPAGWDLTGSSCSDGSAPAAVGLGAGETVTCTFTYVKRGVVRVDVITQPSGDAQSFGFAAAGESFSLTDAAAPHASAPLVPGTYAVTPSPTPADWDLTASSCSDGSAPASVSLGAGETVTCTFTYVKRGRITLVEDARPDDAQDFGFSIAGPSAQSFPLDDDADPGLLSSRTLSSLVPGAYTATQDDAGAMWDLTSLSCTSSLGFSGSVDLASRRASFQLRPGESLTCTFVNTKRVRIVVVKMLEDPTPGQVVDPAQWLFTFSPSWGASFTLKHAQQHQGPWLKGGVSYSVAETGPGGFEVSSSCVFGNGSLVTGGASVSVTPAPGTEVTCTFVNALRIHPGSSGFWKNWRNHYTDAQFRLILQLSLQDSPVYASLFDGAGNLRSDAISLIDALYASGGDGGSRTLLRELTSTLLNLGVSTIPAIEQFQNNDDISRDTALNLTSLPGAEALIRALAPCDIAAGIRIGDVIDILEASWNGDVASGLYRFDGLSSSQQGTLSSVLTGVNNGDVVRVDPDTYPADPSGFPLGGPVTTIWFRDADGDGHGVSSAWAQGCDDVGPAGYAASTDDCDDTHGSVYPGAAEVCDGLRNDCQAQGWPALGGLEQDNDGDGYAECAGDCADADASRSPGKTEVCNAKDDNCNGQVDEDGLGEDSDGDGVRNLCDNCNAASNTDQSDADHDGIGDACDGCPALADARQLDADHDGIGDACDNCLLMGNAAQDDNDEDSIGDACDNCAGLRNVSQGDLDQDGEGDACDLNDGLIYLAPSPAGPSYVEWQSETGYQQWNVYRGSLSVLRNTRVYTQPIGSNPMAARFCRLAVPYVLDTMIPPVGSRVFYLVSGYQNGIETGLGTDSTGAERPITSPCP